MKTRVRNSLLGVGLALVVVAPAAYAKTVIFDESEARVTDVQYSKPIPIRSTTKRVYVPSGEEIQFAVEQPGGPTKLVLYEFHVPEDQRVIAPTGTLADHQVEIIVIANVNEFRS